MTIKNITESEVKCIARKEAQAVIDKHPILATLMQVTNSLKDEIKVVGNRLWWLVGLIIVDIISKGVIK